PARILPRLDVETPDRRLAVRRGGLEGDEIPAQLRQGERAQVPRGDQPRAAEDLADLLERRSRRVVGAEEQLGLRPRAEREDAQRILVPARVIPLDGLEGGFESPLFEQKDRRHPVVIRGRELIAVQIAKIGELSQRIARVREPSLPELTVALQAEVRVDVPE